MSHTSKRKPRIANPLIRQSVESGEFIPLGQWLRDHGIGRSTFYRKADKIPSVRVGRRVYVARAAQVPA